MRDTTQGARRWSVVGGRWSVVALAAIIAGCGSRSGDIGGGQPQQDRVSQLMTSVVLVKKWTQIFYPPPSAPATPCEFSRTQERLPDRTLITEFTYTTCIREKRTDFPDRTARSEFQFPDGRSLTETRSRLQTSGSISRQTVQREYQPSGDRVNWSFEYDTHATPLTSQDDTVKVTGQVDFKAQPSARFTVQQTFGTTGADSVDMVLGDGARFTLTVPVQNPQGIRVPRTGEVVRGSYTSSGQKLEFELRGAGGGSPVGNDWTLTAPDGVTGRFALNADFSGSGQILRNGQIDTSITWDADGKAAVTLVSGEATSAGPSAAALAFLLHAWRELTVQTGPAPGR